MNPAAPDQQLPLSTSSGGFWKPFLIVSAVVVGLLFVSGSAVYVWAQQYEGRIPPGVSIAGIDVSGQDPEHIRQLLQSRIDTILTNGISVTVEGETKTLMLASLSSTDLIEDVAFDLDTLLTMVMAGHHPNPVIDSLKMLSSAVEAEEQDIIFATEEDRIKQHLRELFPEKEILSQNASFVITHAESDWSVEVEEGHAGREFVWQPFFAELENQLAFLTTTGVSLSLIDKSPDVSRELATSQMDQARSSLLAAPYPIVFEDLSWELTAEELMSLLSPGVDGHITFNDEAYAQWVEKITGVVNQNTQDARLVIENGRVTEFVESHDGKTTDMESLRSSLLSRIQSASADPVELVVNITEPTVKTEDVNDLGIDEMLGVGTSSYRGSPTNRRGNIQNGVNLLNGLLIPPGETFSLLAALSPFTLENGYLPELVIKGDKITPEIGGGLCQIGTTTFRATMNSGLPVVERQNHSLVVSYYNDPSNGNPGTDATIYEPAPDFKFTNDTEHYILFQAENLTDAQQLQFTFWGTSDGRTGSYSPPVVERWIPVPEKQIVETTDLEPGVEQCQNSHIGADASFTYTVTRPDASVQETLFTSHYRPLPEICLVGVEELTETPTEVTNETLP